VAFYIAQHLAGKTINSMKNDKTSASGIGKYMPRNDDDTNQCANFVSACLRKSGRVPLKEGSTNVSTLATNLI
jgi:hypothetical protein